MLIFTKLKNLVSLKHIGADTVLVSLVEMSFVDPHGRLKGLREVEISFG